MSKAKVKGKELGGNWLNQKLPTNQKYLMRRMGIIAVVESAWKGMEKMGIPNRGRVPAIGKCWANINRTIILFEEKYFASKSKSTRRNCFPLWVIRELKCFLQATIYNSQNSRVADRDAGVRNSEAADFSRLFTGLIEQTLQYPAGRDSEDLTDDPSVFVKSHPLFSYQESVLSLSKTITDSAESIRNAFVPTLDRDLELGRGWEKDSTDAVDVLLEGRQSTHDKLLATIVEGYKGNKAQEESEDGEDIGQREWKTTTRKARKGIGKLMKSLSVPLPDSEG
ncbi:unnamed protein product [Tuber aestivum]|uniref:Uncharacterized protein n=1 Tax=Tuber aestivum TaxID=59557 RepID=A0A292Q562_9PEZI|nr:unnamed protein product [Tuber aestivum]